MRAWPGLFTLALIGCGGAAPAAGPSKDEIAQDTIEGKADWTLDWCQAKGWYGDGECDLFCPRHDPDCDRPPLGPEPSGTPARFPIVLIHGFDGSPGTRFAWNEQIAAALERDGHTVLVATIPPYDSLDVRDAALRPALDQLFAKTGAAKINLIAHSMGGLDARRLIASVYGDRIASLTTISTPHRGTAIADVALELIPGVADVALNALYSALGGEAATDSHVRAALHDLAEANTLEIANDPRVYYQSWAGVSSVTGRPNAQTRAACEGRFLAWDGTFDQVNTSLVPMAPFVGHGTALLPNDGLVTVASAKWGEFQGCVPADHLREVGRGTDGGHNPATGFDAVRFYRNLAFGLSAKGF